MAPKGREKETIKRLARVGYDFSIGYLEGGFDSWIAEGRDVDTIEAVDVAGFQNAYTRNHEISILDVRKPGEWSSAHIATAQHFALDFLNDNMAQIDKQKTYYMHCRSGYRSTIAASILKARGYGKLINVIGSFDDIAASEIPVSTKVCPKTGEPI